MFFKKLKTTLTLATLTFLIIPINSLAYSKSIIAGGENIGITIKSNGIIIVDTYDINGDNIATDAGLKKGDIIKTINDHNVTSIDEMVEEINHNDQNSIKVTYYRNDKVFTTNLKLIKEDNVYKTGLYVKDSVTGIGTLTFIDPRTHMYGA